MAANKKSFAEKGIGKNRWLIAGGILVMVIALVFLRKLQFVTSDTSKIVPTAKPTPYILDSKDTVDQKKYIDMAVNDLAGRLKINADQINLVQVVANTFGNTSLGCPKPGVMYAQVLTPGFVIELSYLNNTYTYHAGLETVVTCIDNGK